MEKQQNKKKILLVEDDALLVKMYTTKFQMEGFDVISASDGKTGLELALSEEPDFIVLDIMLPNLSGLDLLRRLRSEDAGRDVPVLILTNLGDKHDAETATKELGAKEYLIKASLTPGQVVEKIKGYLD